MKKFNQLSKAEMRKVNGGVPPVCNVDNTCIVFIQHVGYLFAYCSSDIMGSCTCSREYNGATIYGDVGGCMSVS
ncbi:hypothetical protein [Pedobacter sp. UC225_65]|uniref:hypothetical protein n=1 Tax=Pedobacter sp. UC225_65 TaxID=3350173 RepID=UPI00366F00F3